MNFAISSWRKTLSKISVRVTGNRNSDNRIRPQNTRLNTELLEDRWTPSLSVPMAWTDGINTEGPLQTFDPHLTQPGIEPVSAPAPVVESLQTLLDGPSSIVDLGGQTWIVPTRLTITTKHNGKTIQNGTIKFTFQGTVPRVGGMEIVQGNRWWDAQGNSVLYPAGSIDLTLKNLILDGDFPYDYGLQEYTESQADVLNKGYNLITTVTNAANSITLENVRFQNSGNSAIAGSFKTFIGRGMSADRVAKHVIGLRGFGGVNANIDGLVVTNSGNVIDFHNDGSFFSATSPDVAVVKNVSALNIRGRSKVAGNNWSIDGSNWSFEQDSVVNLNLYPAFDLSKHPRRFVIDGFVAINFPTMGIGTLADTRTGGIVRFTNVYIRDSLAGIKAQQNMTVVNAEFEGVSDRYRSSVPLYQSNNIDTATKSDAAWAAVYDQINLLYAAKNAEWGTDFTPSYWAPKSVQLLCDSSAVFQMPDQGASEQPESFVNVGSSFAADTNLAELTEPVDGSFDDPPYAILPPRVLLTAISKDRSDPSSAERGPMKLRIEGPVPPGQNPLRNKTRER